MLKPGSTFVGYEILSIAGRGSMAVTYRARRLSDNRIVALKVPIQRCLKDSTFALRFLQEANLGARLRSPFIVRIYEAGEVEGYPYLTMEYLQGMTLKEGLHASGRVALRRALHLARDICEALEYAHSHGVVHRDLKPENVMMRVGKCLKVMDFGIAKMVDEVGLTSSNIFIGTPYYAAPEMVDSRSVDHRADLYSLAMMPFEMLQGTVPFRGSSAIEIIMKHQTHELPAFHELEHPVPREVYRLVEQLGHKRPEQRLPDARSVRLALELLLASSDKRAGSPTVIRLTDPDDAEYDDDVELLT